MLTDSAKREHDRLRLSLTYAFQIDSDTALDPVANGLELHLGAGSEPVTVSIAPADAGWKVKTKKGRPTVATWRSAKGVSPRVTVAIDLMRGLLTVTVTRADFAAAP